MPRSRGGLTAMAPCPFSNALSLGRSPSASLNSEDISIELRHVPHICADFTSHKMLLNILASIVV